MADPYIPGPRSGPSVTREGHHRITDEISCKPARNLSLYMCARKTANSLINGTAPSDSGSNVYQTDLKLIKRIMSEGQNVLDPDIGAVDLTIIGPRGKTAYNVSPDTTLTSDALKSSEATLCVRVLLDTCKSGAKESVDSAIALNQGNLTTTTDINYMCTAVRLS